jgi:hypothetical protein
VVFMSDFLEMEKVFYGSSVRMGHKVYIFPILLVLHQCCARGNPKPG